MLSARWLVAALTSVPCAAASAQGVVAPGDVLVVTTDGLFFVRPAAGPAVHVGPPAAFGVGQLSQPSVEWRRGTDVVMVTNGAQLLEATLIGPAGGPPSGVAVNDVSPALPGGAVPLLADLDEVQGSGELWLLDRGNALVHSFAPPFASGMTPQASAAVTSSTRGMAADGRRYPLAITFADGAGVHRLTPTTGSVELLALLFNGNGADCDPSFVTGSFVCRKNDHEVAITVGSPNVVVSLNLSGFCTPIALGPRDVEFEPIKRRVHVLAEDGVSTCMGFFNGGNHVVKLPVPSGPLLPEVITDPAGSGITGVNGDLTIVTDDFAFVRPYGVLCTGGLGEKPRVDLNSPPELGNSFCALLLEDAPAHAPWVLLFGAAGAAIPVGGCLLQGSPDLLLLMPPADGAGESQVALPIPSSPTLLGLDAYLQAIPLEPNGHALPSQGLHAHLGK